MVIQAKAESRDPGGYGMLDGVRHEGARIERCRFTINLNP